MQKCPKCGTRFTPSFQMNFCGECGANLESFKQIQKDPQNDLKAKPILEPIQKESQVELNISQDISKDVLEPIQKESQVELNISQDISKDVFEPFRDNSQIALNDNQDTLSREEIISAVADYISRKMVENIKVKFLGLECLKCGSQLSLKLFLHSETIDTSTRYSTSHRTKSIRIPVCTKCHSELSAWKRSHSTSRGSYYNVICLIFWGIIGFCLASIFFPSATIFILLAFVFGFLYIVYKRIARSQVDSPFRYVKFRGKATYVRPRGTGTWVRYDLWLREIMPLQDF
ncbi:MAG: hypothetical protein ACFE8B_07605 [Candidatus Hermodarchaeota archaeon]